MRSTTTAGLLARAITRTEPHIGHDQPGLGVIRLEAAGGELFAVAMDGLTLGMDRSPADSAGPWHADLDHVSVPAVQAWLARLAPETPVRIGAAPAGPGTSITLRAGYDMLRVVNPEPSRFPNWRAIVREQLAAPTDMVPMTCYDPALLGRLAAGGLGHLTAWQTGPAAPLTLTSDGFLALVAAGPATNRHRALITAEWTITLTAA